MNDSNGSKPSPRDAMPNVARLVDEARAKFGKDHVHRCISRGMAGIPGWFYAFENGMVQGTPFDGDEVTMDLLRLSVSLGGRWAMVMQPPKSQVSNG